VLLGRQVQVQALLSARVQVQVLVLLGRQVQVQVLLSARVQVQVLVPSVSTLVPHPPQTSRSGFSQNHSDSGCSYFAGKRRRHLCL
jgi:hypothetical protein